MKLISKDAVLAMIEELESQNNCGTDDFIESKRIAYKQVKDGILEMQEIVSMQEEPVSEDFETALEKKVREAQDWTYIEEEGGECPLNEEFGAYDLEEFARWAADWQKQQMMAKAFDFTKEHNTACILASECLRNHGWFGRERDFNNLFRHLSCVDKLFEGKFSGKTKVIVIKED